MAHRLARRAEDREVPGSSPHPRLTFQSCSRYQLNQLGGVKPHQNRPSKSRILAGYQNNNRLYFFDLVSPSRRSGD